MNTGEIQSGLDQFNGSETIYRHVFNRLCYTEGVKYLAEAAEAYWLIDAIASYQGQLAGEGFQLWHLKRSGGGATLTARTDSDQPAMVTQEIEYTDFPLDEIKLYCCEGAGHHVLMLPGEY
jgi:uncharacterized protein DUF6876